MTMTTSELLMKNVIRNTAPALRRQRFLTVNVPQKDDNREFNARSVVRGDGIGSCVAFKKPHLPPFFGPVVVLYLLEMFNKDPEDK